MASNSPDRFNRKYWEYVHSVYGLKQLDCLQPTTKVLALGCGFETPMFYLTNHVEHVFGIDLFEGIDDPQAALAQPERYANFAVRPGHITLRKMDGRHLEFEDNAFDIVYSLSSIEHFGGHEAAAQAMREIGRVLKPDGVAVISTELVLNGVQQFGIPNLSFFLISDLYDYVIRPSGLKIIGNIDFSISPEVVAHAPLAAEEKRRPFLAIYMVQTLFASLMLFLKKI